MRLFKVLKKLAKWLLLTLLSFVLFLAFLEIFYPLNLQKYNDLSRVVTDRDGRWVYTTLNSQDKWRFRADLNRVDPLYLKMLLNYEDKRFYSHFGVDFLALSRASWQLASSGKIKSGASTITMQLARLLEPKERTFSSKIVEIFRSFQLELHYSKEEILRAYLTLTPYGGNIEGIMGASLHYFGKLPYSLTPSECAILVSLPQNPEQNRLDRYPKRAIKARDKVLERSFNDGVISKATYSIAKNLSIDLKIYKFPRFAPHLSSKALRNKDTLEVNTTLFLPLQVALEKWARDVGDRLPKGVTLSVIVADNRNGEIVAYIGSHNIFSKKVAGFIDMVDAIRSPGSVLKPLIYAIGFSRHIIDTNTVIKDNESQFGDYRPHNFTNRYSGEVTVANALINSLNIPAIKVLEKIGAQGFIDILELASNKVVVPKKEATLPIALGGLGIKQIQVAQLFSLIANGGEGRELHFIKGDSVKKISILDKSSLRKVTNILREVPPPRGYTNKNGFFAYKTGTSYGYRDFWSAIYSKNFSAVILVSKPDNSPIFKSSARDVAAPFAFDVMSYVKNMLPHSSWSKDSSLTTQIAPPKLLKKLEEREVRRDSFDFLYPKNNSKFQSASCKDVAVELKLKGGKAPYSWYIDGKTSKNQDNLATIFLNAGAHSISVIDSAGEHIYRDIWVYAPSCE